MAGLGAIGLNDPAGPFLQISYHSILSLLYLYFLAGAGTLPQPLLPGGAGKLYPDLHSGQSNLFSRCTDLQKD